MRQAGLFGLSEHLKRLSAHGDPLEESGEIIDFEAFRPVIVAALAYSDGSKDGRPRYDPVAMLKVLVLDAHKNVADARMEYLIHRSSNACGPKRSPRLSAATRRPGCGQSAHEA